MLIGGLGGRGRPRVGARLDGPSPRREPPRPAKPAGPSAEEARVALGRELFHREWTPGDPRARGGDGLGPVYNDSSCVACHNLGGPGGGGPANKNVDIVTGPANSSTIQAIRARDGRPAVATGSRRGVPSAATAERRAPPASATDPDFAAWRVERLGETGPLGRPRRGGAEGRGRYAARPGPGRAGRPPGSATPSAPSGGAILRSQRNSSSAPRRRPDRRDPGGGDRGGGRAAVPRLPRGHGPRRAGSKDGAIGRFGWKGQTPSLDEFVRTACSVELGLEVPGHAQAGDPLRPRPARPGLDLNDADCDALTAYVRSLSAAGRGRSPTPEATRAGGETFAAVGCATCHMPDLGPARGIYSDLLAPRHGPRD